MYGNVVCVFFYLNNNTKISTLSLLLLLLLWYSLLSKSDTVWLRCKMNVDCTKESTILVYEHTMYVYYILQNMHTRNTHTHTHTGHRHIHTRIHRSMFCVCLYWEMSTSNVLPMRAYYVCARPFARDFMPVLCCVVFSFLHICVCMHVCV